MDSSKERSLQEESSLDAADLSFENRGGCYCFFPPCSRRRTPAADGIAEGSAAGWYGRGLRAMMKVRKWSDVVSGPRWKTFLRRFNRQCRCSRLRRRFQYDPLSYALNFDDGFTESGSPEADAGLRGFSLRYAVPPTAARPGLDLLGGKDAPTLLPVTAG